MVEVEQVFSRLHTRQRDNRPGKFDSKSRSELMMAVVTFGRILTCEVLLLLLDNAVVGGVT